MHTEQSLKSIINQYNQKIKKLEGTIALIRAEKKKYQIVLRDIRWEKKENRSKRASN